VAAAIEMIESSTRVQARLVEDLLDVSRIIAGKLRVDLAPVELRPVVEAVVEMFHARADERKITLETDIEERPLSVYGDETRRHRQRDHVHDHSAAARRASRSDGVAAAPHETRDAEAERSEDSRRRR